ncbi:hypothetical protein [Paenibacillus sp. IHBB 3054]|uniref:hypothetical protein n=1 Tax=Paenibacillus sp. IHBB 3054 TaxID=3425689 RepID=UPI003F6717B5
MKPNRGLPKNRLTPEKRVHFRPEITYYPNCGIKLKETMYASHKIVATLNRILDKSCLNVDCAAWKYLLSGLAAWG